MEETNYWKRLNRRRFSRRTVLSGAGTLAVGGAAAMVVGCGGDDGGGNGTSGTPRPVPSPPVPGGEITLGRAVGVGGIDPHIDLTGLDIDTLLYSYLYGWAPRAETPIFNNLATGLEQPEPTTFIFTLRPGIRNSPGGPAPGYEFTSRDVKESFVRRGTSITAPDKRFPRKIAGSSDAEALRAALQTPDPLTFSFEMSEPFVPGVREMANPTWAIVSAPVLDEYTSLAQEAYGSGPFMLREFRGNERIVLEKNPDFWIPDRPYLDGMTYVVITENSSLLSAFEQRQHDVCGANLTKSQYDDWQDNPDYRVAFAPSLFYPVIHLNVRRSPFEDVRVREALNISIDRDQLIEVAQRGEGEYNGPIQWPQVKWALPQEELREFYKRDVEKAKQLLDGAGYGDGFDSIIKTPRLVGVNILNDIARIVQANWREIGVNVEIDEVELGSYIGSTLLAGNFDMTFFPNLPYDEPDRPLAFYHSLGVTGNGNWTGYNNQDLDKLIDEQAREFDEPKRQEIVNEAQRLILAEHGPQLTLTGGTAYTARWWYVHFPFEISEDPSAQANPNGVDWWRQQADLG